MHAEVLMDEDDEPEPDPAYIAKLCEQVRRQRIELTRTLAAIRSNRRTPQQIRALVLRARALLHRSVLIRRRHERIRRVH
jgi:hypothetical protein